jgi:hypothetical protein
VPTTSSQERENDAIAMTIEHKIIKTKVGVLGLS